MQIPLCKTTPNPHSIPAQSPIHRQAEVAAKAVKTPQQATIISDSKTNTIQGVQIR
ncbi:MAG: hypothetical protein ACI4BD_02185 [Paludibacteraceae bacterium]